MKSEIAKRYIAVLLIFSMVITAISFSSIRAHEDNSISPMDMRETGSVYVLDVSELANGAIPSSMPAGTENYFTLHGGDGAEIQDSRKSFDDGYSATKRINFPSTDVNNMKNLIEFSTKSAASVTVWFVASNDNREITVYKYSDSDCETVYGSGQHLVTEKNKLYIHTFSLNDAGTYYLGGNPNNYYFKISVAESVPEARGNWEEVDKPQIADVEQVGENIEVTVKANVGANGGDRVTVEMFRDGEHVGSKSSASGNPSQTHTVTFKPGSSGTYTFTAVLSRDGEVAKANPSSFDIDYVLPLGIPVISSIFNEGVIDETGKGNVYLTWSAVDEAEGYNIYCDGNLVGSTDKTKYTVSGLDTAKHTFKVTAVRGTEESGFDTVSDGSDESVPSNVKTIDVTEEKEDNWEFVAYGPSSDTEHNGMAKNDDGTVTVWSENERGKIQPKGPDGLALYYTAIPNDLDFTFRVNVSVENWRFSNGQEGFGLLALDSVPEKSSVAYFWTNQYMAAVSKIDYRYDPDAEGGIVYSGGSKYSMRLGVGVNTKLGITPDILDSAADDIELSDRIITSQRTLDTKAGELGLEPGSYNIVGNYVGAVDETIAVGSDGKSKGITDFILEIRRAENGYAVSYYNQEGGLIREQKYYGADSLSQLDGDYVYVGFFASRNARATFSVDEFTIYESKEKFEDQEPILQKPAVTVKSGPSSSTEDYTLILTANVSGTAVISVTQNGEPVKQKNQSRSDNTKIVNITKDERARVELTVAPDSGRPILNIESLATSSNLGLEFDFASDNEANSPNLITIEFTPDKNAGDELGDGYVLDYDYNNNKPITKTHYVEYNTYFANQKNLYIAPVYDSAYYESPDERPFGSPTGNGSPTCPLDVYSAVNFVHPGQNIIIMPGLYRLDYPVIIQRGIDGGEGKKIKMITMTDDEDKSEDDAVVQISEEEKYFVFCFRGKSSGIKCGGNNWYFNGFDVKNTIDRECGFYVCGSNNTLERIHAYYNGNTGIQISAFNNSNDFKEDWPKNNTILNCTSCYNSDLGQQDADGFAAKLTVGEGNVFNGCVAFNNADDGFDLFSKVATGAIERVVIQNCIAYRNGYDADNSITEGNGSGFKMGGENIPIDGGNDGTSGGHWLINSIAFENKENGITSNSCPNIYIERCTSFNNGTRNIYLYTTDTGKETAFTVNGLVSFSNSADATKWDDRIQCNTSDSSNYKSVKNYYYENGLSVNSANSNFTAEMFISDEYDDDGENYNIVKRDANGNIKLDKFLVPVDAENFTGAIFEPGNGSNTDLSYEEDIRWPHSCGTATTPQEPEPEPEDSKEPEPEISEEPEPGVSEEPEPEVSEEPEPEVSEEPEPEVSEEPEPEVSEEPEPEVSEEPEPEVSEEPEPENSNNSTVHFNVPATETTSTASIESEPISTVSEPVTAVTTTEPAVTVLTTTASANITTMPIVSDTTDPVDGFDPFMLDEDAPEGNRNLVDPSERNPYTGVTAAVVPVVLAALSVTGVIIVKRKNGKK